MESRMLLKVFGAEEYSQEVAKNLMKKHQKQRMRRTKWSIFCSGGFSAILRVVYLAGAISCGYGMIQGSISYGTLTAVLQLVGQLQTPLTGLTGYVPKYFALLASAERILEPEEFPVEEETVYRTELTKLVLNHVGFKYPGEKEYILKDISAEIKCGEMIAFIGHSGCGKSTLMKLILGLYDITEGELYFSPEEGVGNLKGFCSYVPQGKYLMNGTIREIITFGKTNDPNSEKKLSWAVQAACADFVWELEKGIDTQLGEQGAGLSEGQLQRLSIARALYADRPVIILDEATSALDEETEWNILNNLKNIKNKTFLVVTHRPAALKLCDRILDLFGLVN